MCLIGIPVIKYVTLDKTAEINELGGFIWKGVQYVQINARAGRLGKCIAKTTDGHKIYEYKDDPSHTFLEISSFLDNNKVVRADYVIPTEGTVSCAYVGGARVYDEDFLEALTQIESCDFTDSFFIGSDDNIEYLASEIYVGYEDCPVATQYFGFIGYINGKWVYISADDVPYEYLCRRNSDINPYEIDRFECHIIPDEYTQAFSIGGLFDERTVETCQ